MVGVVETPTSHLVHFFDADLKELLNARTQWEDLHILKKIVTNSFFPHLERKGLSSFEIAPRCGGRGGAEGIGSEANIAAAHLAKRGGGLQPVSVLRFYEDEVIAADLKITRDSGELGVPTVDAQHVSIDGSAKSFERLIGIIRDATGRGQDRIRRLGVDALAQQLRKLTQLAIDVEIARGTKRGALVALGEEAP